MTPRRVLLVGPRFHGYTGSVASALGTRGHDVTTHLYDVWPTLGAKLRGKVLEELPQRLGAGSSWPAVQTRTTDEALRVLCEVRPEVVLAIKADALTRGFWEAARTSGALTHLWLYDELRRTRVDPDVLPSVDVLTSYSALDTAALLAEGLEATHVANGFDDHVPWTTRQVAALVFVGARYPNRERLLVEVHARGVPVLAVGRDWSGHPLDRLRTWDLHRPALPAARDVDRAAAYGLMAGAAANLNVHHDQDGFTMRTFEIPGTGGLQVVDRPDVAAYYDPGTEVVVAEGADEVADVTRRALADPSWARSVGAAGRRRTLAEHTMAHRVAELEALWA
ncbi:glycosyltransferase [Phycicoccus sp. CSK15P-2]|uniref:CgeB family protein n=1 Tax=Phycicoccus sp. CSK15P-2 TaxID=2807627 RepID=UPI001951477F|nr:glycosyltransferase [Phycicoccus sp. CSK15P-2]MBM6404312.1 glycosyltransferase [Phycicoccus sp. CSK15P-2]